ncbi:MAG: class I SAM-dependent methyltransferase [Candidatus Spechtbacterales bacterium]
MDLKKTYNHIAEDWYQDHKDDDWSFEGARKFTSLLPPGGNVLDVGCGPGIKTKLFVEQGFHATGVDFSEKMVDIAKREVPGGTFLVLDVKELDALDGMFDGIFMQAVLLHVHKNEAMDILRQTATKLKPGGYVYVAVKEQQPGMPAEEMRREDDYGYSYERFFSYYTVDEIKDYMHVAGFEEVSFDITPIGKTRWLQVIGKKPS